jgi:hypothetical protein
MMADETKTKLLVITTATPVKSSMRGAKDEARKLLEEGIPVDKLQRGFANFMDGLTEIVKGGYSKVGDFALDEITFSAEIGADGEFKLLGTGVGVSANCGVSFTLHRQSSDTK